MKAFGYSLIELIVAIGVIAALTVIAIIAINPARQFANARNTQRQNDVHTLYKAIEQHRAKSDGVITPKINNLPQLVCNKGSKATITCAPDTIDLRPELVDTHFISDIPSDPVGTESDTRYMVAIGREQCVTVWAVEAELDKTIFAGCEPNMTLHFIRTNNSYVRIPDSPSLTPLNTLSIGAWFKTADNALDQAILSKTQSSGYQLSLNYDRNTSCKKINYANLCFRVYIDTPPGSSNGNGYYKVTYPIFDENNKPLIANDTWYHVVGTYDGSTLRLYLNGQEVDSLAIAGRVRYRESPLCLGAELKGSANDCTQGEYFDGQLDNLFLYNRALTPQEVLDHYTEAAYSPTGLAGYWRFSEGKGLTTRDESGNNNDGYLIQAPGWGFRI